MSGNTVSGKAVSFVGRIGLAAGLSAILTTVTAGCGTPLFHGGLPTPGATSEQRKSSNDAPQARSGETQRDAACTSLLEPCPGSGTNPASGADGTKTSDMKKAPAVIKTNWTLVYPTARSFRMYMVGCEGTSAYFYKNPTPDDVKMFRQGIAKFLKAKGFTAYDVWAGDLKDQLRFYSVNVEAGTVKDLGQIAFGGPSLPVVCKCSRDDKGQYCGDGQTPHGEPFSAEVMQ